MTQTEIKARLYDLQYHACNGRLTVRQDGTRDPDDKPCTGCAEILKLQALLKENT